MVILFRVERAWRIAGMYTRFPEQGLRRRRVGREAILAEGRCAWHSPFGQPPHRLRAATGSHDQPSITRSPTYSSGSVLTGAFAAKHFQHHPQPSTRNRRRPGRGSGRAADAARARVVHRPPPEPMRWRLAMKVFLSTVGAAGRTVVAGGAAVGVQMREVRFVHGKAPCRAIGSRHPKVAGGTWFEPGWPQPAGRTAPRTARHSRQTDCQPGGDAGWQALSTNSGFEARPPFSVARHLSPWRCAMPIRRVANITRLETLLTLSYAVKPASAGWRSDPPAACNLRQVSRLSRRTDGRGGPIATGGTNSGCVPPG